MEVLREVELIDEGDGGLEVLVPRDVWEAVFGCSNNCLDGVSAM
jgi:hypothetical protein